MFSQNADSTEKGLYARIPSGDPSAKPLLLPRVETAPGWADTVQFSSPIYIANVAEGKLSCDIMRIGELRGTLSFAFQTLEGSALHGRQFLHTSGVVAMNPGQDSTVIEVELLDQPGWNPATEFSIQLLNPEGCNLGIYLKDARIKVYEESTFPASRFKLAVEQGEDGIQSINELMLFSGFVSLLRTFDGITWRTVVSILLEQFRNAYIYMRLVLAIYMVDKVFDSDSESGLLVEGDRLSTAYVVAALIICPWLVLFVVEHLKIQMDIKGRLRRDLSKSLFRKFMNYNTESIESVPMPDMIVAVTQDVKEATMGYSTVIEMVRIAGKIALHIFFTLSHNPDAWWAVVLVPCLMLFWAACRTKVYIQVADDAGDGESGLTAFVDMALTNMNLIANYRQRPQMNDLFAEKSEGLRKLELPETRVMTTNMFFPRLLGPALVAVYTAIGSKLVLGGDLKLGVYLATIHVFGDICESFSEFFELMMDITGTFCSLKGLTCLLNKATDLPALEAIGRKRRQMTQDTRAELLKSSHLSSGHPFVPAADHMEVKMVDVSFTYPGSDPLFNQISFACPQGKICAVSAEPSCGRRTLLELLAHSIFPSNGTLFVPSHLRIVYVTRDVCLLNLSVWRNLTFGNSKGNNPYRVEEILKALEMSTTLHLCSADLEARKQELAGETAAEQPNDESEEAAGDVSKGTNPLDTLPESEKANVHLARALITNPEIMVLHRPFTHYHNRGRALLTEALIQQRDNRGFKMPPEERHLRRPRTIFFSANSQEESSIADIHWVIPDRHDSQAEREDVVHRRCVQRCLKASQVIAPATS